MKKHKNLISEILWFVAAFIVLDLVCFLSAGRDILLSLYYLRYNNSLESHLLVYHFSYVACGIISAELILWSARRPLVRKVKFAKMPYYILMAVMSAVIVDVLGAIDMLLPHYSGFSSGINISVFSMFFAMVVSFVLWISERVLFSQTNSIDLPKKAERTLNLQRQKKSNTATEIAGFACGVLVVLLHPLLFLLYTGDVGTIYSEYVAAVFKFFDAQHIVYSILTIVSVEAVIWIGRARIMRMLDISRFSCYFLAASAAAFLTILQSCFTVDCYIGKGASFAVITLVCIVISFVLWITEKLINSFRSKLSSPSELQTEG